MFEIAILMGILSSIALLVILWKIGMRKFLGYPVTLDIVASLLFTLLFAGTLTGMLVAVIAGLTFTAIVFILRAIMGFQKWSFKNGWTYFPPRRLT